MSKQETAMKKLIDYCIRQIALYKDDAPNVAHAFLYAKTKAESLLEKERQQIIDACHDGKMMTDDNYISAELYYNQKFGSHDKE